MVNVITIDWSMAALLLVLGGNALVLAVLVYIVNKLEV